MAMGLSKKGLERKLSKDLGRLSFTIESIPMIYPGRKRKWYNGVFGIEFFSGHYLCFLDIFLWHYVVTFILKKEMG